MNSEQLEKYSSAITLSDMEVFVFPELMYALLLGKYNEPVNLEMARGRDIQKT